MALAAAAEGSDAGSLHFTQEPVLDQAAPVPPLGSFQRNFKLGSPGLLDTATAPAAHVARAARQLRVSQGATEALLHETAWPQWLTIARIERNLGVQLWV